MEEEEEEQLEEASRSWNGHQNRYTTLTGQQTCGGSVARGIKLIQSRILNCNNFLVIAGVGKGVIVGVGVGVMWVGADQTPKSSFSPNTTPEGHPLSQTPAAPAHQLYAPPPLAA